MSFWRWKYKIYPLLALLSGLVILVFGLITAKTLSGTYFLAASAVVLIAYGCGRIILRILPVYIITAWIFGWIVYSTSGGNLMAAIAMANRFGAVFLAMVPGMSVKTTVLTRNLAQLGAPKSLTLGMLIVMSFIPLLGAEIRRVREATKTRGAGSILNPKILYRALLVPFATRLIDISDTLALSVETRGFTLNEQDKVSVYRREYICLSDVIYICAFVAGAVSAVII